VLYCVATCCSEQTLGLFSHMRSCLAVLQCGAVCCSVLQCGAVCCSVLQCGAVCCSDLQRVSLDRFPRCTRAAQSHCGVLQGGAMYCSVLQCVASVAVCSSAMHCLTVCIALCCSVWHCVAVWYARRSLPAV